MSLLVSSSFARDVVRLLAGWLACIVFVQATASAVGLVQGPRHVHVRAEAQAPAVFVHAAAHAHSADHHDHGGWARHVHLSPTPGATLSDDAQELGAAAGLVLAAMVALGPLRQGVAAAEGCHVMRAWPAWSCTTHVMPLPERPPRT